MLEILIAGTVVLMIVLIMERISKKKNSKSELTRKIPHVAAAIAVASLPFFVSFTVISYGSLIYLVFVAVMYRLNLFEHSRAVDRQTYGEIFFALGVLSASLLTDSKWIFAAAILTLGLADTAAALFGQRYGKIKIEVLGNVKSFEGSIAFWCVSVIIMIWLVFTTPSGLDYAWPVIIWLPLLAAGSEALLPLGADNLVVPLLITATLNSLSLA